VPDARSAPAGYATSASAAGVFDDRAADACTLPLLTFGRAKGKRLVVRQKRRSDPALLSLDSSPHLRPPHRGMKRDAERVERRPLRPPVRSGCRHRRLSDTATRPPQLAGGSPTPRPPQCDAEPAGVQRL